jgi:phospholipase C
VPFLALWGTKYRSISHRLTTFLDDCRTGKLPAVSFVDPRFIEESSGLSNDDHPHADIRNGQVFQNAIYTAVTTGRAWHNTMLVFVYDEWGGFFDHVAPAVASTSAIDRAAGYTDGLRGFRIPAIIVAPFARRAAISSTTFDHTSVLRFIEWRWRLDPLTERDATANNLAEVLDFDRRNLAAPQYEFDPGPYGGLCPVTEPDDWAPIRDLARAFGYVG